jgi:hypothetical protein
VQLILVLARFYYHPCTSLFIVPFALTQPSTQD